LERSRKDGEWTEIDRKKKHIDSVQVISSYEELFTSMGLSPPTDASNTFILELPQTQTMSDVNTHKKGQALL